MASKNNNKIPIVMVHRGRQPYFELVLEMNFRENANIIVISDQQRNLNHCRTVSISSLSSSRVDTFSRHYEHLNTTPFDYELFCFQRWFLLLEYMESMNLDIVMHIDSDVILFSNPDHEIQHFSNFMFTLTHRTTASSSFFTREGLQKFCDFLISTFTDKHCYHYRKIKSHFDVLRECNLPGGVCDMTYFDHFEYLNCGQIGEMMYIHENSTFDHNINSSDGVWEFKNGIKHLNFKDGSPYVLHEPLGRFVKFNSIHLQGPAKMLAAPISNLLYGN